MKHLQRKRERWQQENRSSVCWATIPCLKRKRKVTAHAFDPNNQRGEGGSRPTWAPHQGLSQKGEKKTKQQGRPVFSLAQLSPVGGVCHWELTLRAFCSYVTCGPSTALYRPVCSFSPTMLPDRGHCGHSSGARGSGLAAHSLLFPTDEKLEEGWAREQGLCCKGRLKS